MCPSEKYPDDEDQLRKALDATAPKPSEQHNESVMAAARRIAAERHGERVTGGRWKPALGMAATLLMAFAVVWLLRTEPPETTYQRGTDDANVIPADGGVLSEMPRRFVWPRDDSTQPFRLKLFNDSALLVWQSPATTAAEITIDGDFELSSGARYFWTIEPAENASAATLGPYWFSLE